VARNLITDLTEFFPERSFLPHLPVDTLPESFHLLFNAIEESLISIDPNGIIGYVNRKTKDLLGFRRGELTGEKACKSSNQTYSMS